jgi:DNA-binding response OmpR family regulator
MVADRSPSLLALHRRLSEAGLTAELTTDRREVGRKAAFPGQRLIVLDLLWPRDDPLVILQKWRSQGVQAHVLALAGDRNPAERVRVLDLGADDVLARPIEPDEFLARVRALLRRSMPPDTVLRVHDLEIDRQAHVVRRGGQAIPLTPREFALLEMLARQPGRVLTRSMILQHLYDGAGEQTSNVVDVYIRYLRNKIDRGFEVPLILTRWGEGYLLRGEPGGSRAWAPGWG